MRHVNPPPDQVRAATYEVFPHASGWVEEPHHPGEWFLRTKTPADPLRTWFVGYPESYFANWSDDRYDREFSTWDEVAVALDELMDNA